MLKLISYILSFAIIFSSVTPSLAQVQASRRQNSPFQVSTKGPLSDAVERMAAKAMQDGADAYWLERGSAIAKEQCSLEGWSCMLGQLYKARQAANGNIEQAVVCSKGGECIPALAYAWGGIHYGSKHLFYYNKNIIVETAAKFAELVGQFGVYYDADRNAARAYFKDLLVNHAPQDCNNGAFEYGSANHRANQRHTADLQAQRCAAEVTVMPIYAMLSKSAAEKSEVNKIVYKLMKSKYDTQAAMMVVQAGVTALGVLGTQEAYKSIETFLTDVTMPSTLGNIWAGIGEPVKVTAQNSLRVASNVRGGNSRYLNRINEQFQYLDNAEAKRQGFNITSWQSERRQYPYGNMLEDIGAFLGQESARNAYARALAKKLVAQANTAAKNNTNAAGVMHYPVVLGILDGWRAHGKRFIYEPSPALLELFYKGDWFDINEGTQRRVHYKAYQFAKARGWTWKAPVKDNAKVERSVYNERLISIGKGADAFVMVLMTGYLFASIPSLARGIPQAVRTLRSRQTWVGASNYFKRAPKAVWSKVKGGPVQAKAVSQRTAAPQAVVAKPSAVKPASATKAATSKPTTAPKAPANKPLATSSAVEPAPVPANTVMSVGDANIVDVGNGTLQWLTPGQQASRINQSAATFASQGEGFANVGKVQQAYQAGTTAQKGASVTAKAPVVKGPQPYILGQTTNSLGQTVPAWVKNPAYEAYVELAKPTRHLSWLDRMRLQWTFRVQPVLDNLATFGKSRYSLMAVGPGAAPVSGEAAVASAGNAVEVVQTIRAEQAGFIAEDFLRGGAGASYRMSTVNPGGVAAARYAQASLQATNAAKASLNAAQVAPLALSTSVVGQNVASGSNRYTSGKLYSSVLPIPTRWLRGIGNAIANLGQTTDRIELANQTAKNVFAKPQPMISQLRDIVLSEANDAYKKMALLGLYNRGVFSSFLKKQPKAVRSSIIDAANDNQRSSALFRLYQAKYLDNVLQNIADIQEQGSVLEELQNLVTQSGWTELARSAYETEDVLPLRNENFAGAVSSVPEADPDKIVGTVRPLGYATQNMNTGRTTSRGIHYDNNIPFYYRDSKGQLSSQPVGILTQIPADWYGRILSNLHLATRPGFTIPEGFILALDEQGQWKFFIPKGHLATAEANPRSKKELDKIKKTGSARVILDTNYTTTDLLAMAHLLEHNKSINLELNLNTPHSLSQFLTGHALFVGNDAGNTLTGPFKESLKALRGVVNMMTNLVSGIGYFTPIAGGYAMPTMSRWGNVKTTKVIYGTAAAALAGSLGFLKMYGTVDPSTLPLWALAIPTVALVLGASLANSFIPTFLNFYKDPAARTAANLDFSTKKQISRLSLSGIVAAAAAIWGLNWTIVVPVGLALLGYSYALFKNTPMYKEEKSRLAKEKQKQDEEAKRWASLTPAQQAAEIKAAQDAAAQDKVQNDKFVEEYKEFRNNQAEMRASKSRVKMVYASYAASLMLLGQSANEAFAGGMGQLFITLCMGATLGTRLLATHLVKHNIMTDDQLTGLSLPTLALTGLGLALLPYSGVVALATGLAGVLHYMATAVPGQLDAARMQNIVTAEMQQRKQKVLDDTSLTENEKETAIARLTAEEKVWSAQASKDYSLYNARGLWGIGTATLGALVFADLGPQWTKDMLNWISSWYDLSSPSLSLNRLLFLYSGTVASILAAKNLDLTADGLRFFRKKQAITEQAIADKQVNARSFGINERNAQIQLGYVTGKNMKEVEPMLIEYGVSSEQKVTNILQQLQQIHNRLVAIGEILGADAVRAGFEREAVMVNKLTVILGQNNLSVMLRREFEKLKRGLMDPFTNQILQSPSYVEEGLYALPQNYQSYEMAHMLVGELDQMTYRLHSGEHIDYQRFIDYMTRARVNLIEYEKFNPADAIRVITLRRQLDDLCKLLAQDDFERGLLNPLETDSKQIRQGKQALRDMLVGYNMQEQTQFK